MWELPRFTRGDAVGIQPLAPQAGGPGGAGAGMGERGLILLLLGRPSSGDGSRCLPSSCSTACSGQPGGLCSLPSPPTCTPCYPAALQRKRDRRKKVNRFLIISCLLSFRPNSAHTKIILHNKRNIYLKKTQRCMASLKI